MSISITIPQLPTADTLAEIASKSAAIARAVGLLSSGSVAKKAQSGMPLAVQQPIGGRLQFIGEGPDDYPAGW